jgi:membrane protein DedA with SNARE-associated domain
MMHPLLALLGDPRFDLFDMALAVVMGAVAGALIELWLGRR